MFPVRNADRDWGEGEGDVGDCDAMTAALARVIVLELLVPERRPLIIGLPCLSVRTPGVSIVSVDTLFDDDAREEAIMCMFLELCVGDTIISSRADGRR